MWPFKGSGGGRWGAGSCDYSTLWLSEKACKRREDGKDGRYGKNRAQELLQLSMQGGGGQAMQTRGSQHKQIGELVLRYAEFGLGSSRRPAAQREHAQESSR